MIGRHLLFILIQNSNHRLYMVCGVRLERLDKKKKKCSNILRVKNKMHNNMCTHAVSVKHNIVNSCLKNSKRLDF